MAALNAAEDVILSNIRRNRVEANTGPWESPASQLALINRENEKQFLALVGVSCGPKPPPGGFQHLSRMLLAKALVIWPAPAGSIASD